MSYIDEAPSNQPKAEVIDMGYVSEDAPSTNDTGDWQSVHVEAAPFIAKLDKIEALCRERAKPPCHDEKLARKVLAIIEGRE